MTDKEKSDKEKNGYLVKLTFSQVISVVVFAGSLLGVWQSGERRSVALQKDVERLIGRVDKLERNDLIFLERIDKTTEAQTKNTATLEMLKNQSK